MEYRLYKQLKNGNIKYLTAYVEDGRRLLSFIQTFNVKGFRSECMVEVNDNGNISMIDLKTFMRIAKLEQI